MNQHAADGRQVIGRQFHDEGHGFALQQAVAQHQAGEHRHGNAQQVERKDDVLPAVREKRGGKQHIHRQTRAAGHERRHGDGHQAVARLFKRARGHQRRHIAAKADNQRHERFARQPHPAHEAVHDKGGARHVARVFQHREENVQKTDNRDESGDRLDAAANAFGQQHGEPFGRTRPFQHLPQSVDAESAEKLVKKVDEGAANLDGEQKHQVHHQQENRDAQRAVQDYAVDALGQILADFAAQGNGFAAGAVGKVITGAGKEDVGIRAQRARAGARLRAQFLARNGVREFVAFQQIQRQPARRHRRLFRHRGNRRQQRRHLCFDALVIDNVHRLRRVRGVRSDGFFQRLHALAMRSDQRHDRATQAPGEHLGIHQHVFFARHIHHVQRHQQRYAHFQQLRGEVQIAFQIGSIDDVDNQAGFARAHEIAGDALVQRYLAADHVQRIRAGQIHHRHRRLMQVIFAGFLFHRHARPVAHALARAGQRIEHGGLAAVWVADQRHHHGLCLRLLHHSFSTFSTFASSLRSVSAEPRT